MKLRTPIALIAAMLTLGACQVKLPGSAETRITGTREGEAATWGPGQAPAAAVQAPAEAAPAGTPLVVAPTDEQPAAPAPAAPAAPTVAEEPPAEADAAMALLALKSYVDAYRAKDPAKVATFEAALLAARRKAEVETAGQFKWSIERGHAEVFLEGQDFNLVTAAFTNIDVERTGTGFTLSTKDGGPLLRATYTLDGKAGEHVIAKIVLERGSDGKMQVAALPFEEAAAPADPTADEAAWPMPDGPIVTGADRDAALDAVAALNDAYSRKDAAKVLALLPESFDAGREGWRARIADDLADALFSVRPLARELLTVVAVGDELEVVGPREVIASFPFKRDGELVQYRHGAIRLKKVEGAWVIVGGKS